MFFCFLEFKFLSFSFTRISSRLHFDVGTVLSNGITENIQSGIHEVGEAENSSYDDEYLSDDEPLVQGFIRIRVVLEGNSVSEQLAIVQGVFLERARHSDDSRQPTGNSSTKQEIFATPGAGKLKTRGRAGLGPVR